MNLAPKTIGQLSVAALFLGLPLLILQWMNTAFVHDPHGVVETAYLDGPPQKRMTHVGLGWYVASIDGDSSFLVECSNGNTMRYGYVTGHMGDTFTVPEGCQFDERRYT